MSQVGVWPRLGCLERWAPLLMAWINTGREQWAESWKERERWKLMQMGDFKIGGEAENDPRRKRGTPQLSRNRALVCLESRRHRGWAQRPHSAVEDWRPPCLKGPPCLTISWQLGFFIMPLFRMDVILTSKRSSYLFRGTREPHFHSEDNFHLVYLRWICWLRRVGTIDLLLFYRFNIPFRMHCWCLFISHIYFCLTVKL